MVRSWPGGAAGLQRKPPFSVQVGTTCSPAHSRPFGRASYVGSKADRWPIEPEPLSFPTHTCASSSFVAEVFLPQLG